MPAEKIETLVIGGGQAGLVMSHRLKQRGLAHLVLERHRIAERWRSERWDGLKFQFPNWSVRLPDFPFPHTDPDAFSTSGDIVGFIEAYANFVGPADPLRRRGDAAARSGRRRFHRGDLGRQDRSRKCRGRHRPYQRTSCRTCCAIMPCFRSMPPITKIPNSFRPARCWWSAPARRARRLPRNCCSRAPRLSLGRPAHPHAAPLSRTGFELVVRRDGPVSDDAGAATTRVNPSHIRRVWRPHHRLSPLRRRWHDPAGKDRGGARGILDIAPGLAESLANGDLTMQSSSTWWTRM